MIIGAVAKSDKTKLLEILHGELATTQEGVQTLEYKAQNPKLYSYAKDEFFCSNGKPYVLSDGTTTPFVANSLRDTFLNFNIKMMRLKINECSLKLTDNCKSN